MIAHLKNIFNESMPLIHCKRPLQIGYLDTPIGELLIQGCHQGLHRVKRSPNNVLVDSDVNLLKRSDVKLKNQIDYEPIKDAYNWFKLYFEDPNKCSSIKTPDFCSFDEYSK